MASGGRLRKNQVLKESYHMISFQMLTTFKLIVKTAQMLISFFRCSGAHVLSSKMSIFNNINNIYKYFYEHLTSNASDAQTKYKDMNIWNYRLF